MILKPFALLIALCAFVSFESSSAGEVKIKQVDDGFRFEIDGELFTHWQTKDWKVGYRKLPTSLHKIYVPPG